MKDIQKLYREAKKIIPGGTQLLSKRPEMFLPDFWPTYYEKASGCRVWDLNGNEFIDMTTMGIGTCILGYADKDVDNAVSKAIEKGNMSSLNTYEEVELAKLLCEIHPWAQMARFARSGGEAMTIAVRIGRSYSKKDKVLFCGYHGWHDWYLSSNLANDKSLDGHLLKGLEPNGVPRNLKGTALPFFYNDINSFKKLVDKHRNEVGVVVLESIRNEFPTEEFLSTVRDITNELNIPLVVDEITSGFRLNLGGAHLNFGIEPDIAVFAKGISNGYPMAAIIGKEKVMQAAETSFISSTYWTDRIGPTSSIATINKIKDNNVPEHLINIGKKVQNIWKQCALKEGIDINISGIYPLSHFNFKCESPLKAKTLFTQFMLEYKFLASTIFYASFAHKESDLKAYSIACEKVFGELKEIIKKEEYDKYLKGPVCHSGFKRLN